MDGHDRAHYAIGAGALALASLVGVHELRAPAPSQAHEWAFPDDNSRANLETALRKIGPHPVRVACAADCGSLPEDLTAALTDSGWSPSQEAVLGGAKGIVVGPDGADAQALADALAAALGTEVKVGPRSDNLGLLIIIGRHPRAKP